MLMSPNGAGRVFQTSGLTTAKLLSPNWVLDHGMTHEGGKEVLKR